MNLLTWRRQPYGATTSFSAEVFDVLRKAYQGMSRYYQAQGHRAYILETECSSDAVESSTKGLALQAPAGRRLFPKSQHRVIDEPSSCFKHTSLRSNAQDRFATTSTAVHKSSTSLRDGVNACGLAFPLQAKPIHIRPRPYLAQVISDSIMCVLTRGTISHLSPGRWQSGSLIGFLRAYSPQRIAFLSRHRDLTFHCPGYLFAISPSTKSAEFLVPNRRTAVPLQVSSTAPIK